MRNYYDVIEIDIYVVVNTLQNFHFQEHPYFVYQFGLKNAEPNIGKLFKTNYILITKYHSRNWNIVKSSIFTVKKIFTLNKNFQNCYWFQMDAFCSVLSLIASFYDIMHLWTNNWVLSLDIH